jgi:hypothetical protein
MDEVLTIGTPDLESRDRGSGGTGRERFPVGVLGEKAEMPLQTRHGARS